MLTLLFLLAVAGIWAVYGVSLEESVEIFRREMLEAKIWICEMLVALDSSRGEPGLGTDSDPEAGLLPPVPAYGATEAALMLGSDAEGHFVLNIFPRERIRRSVSPLPVTVDAPTANLDISFEELELTQLIGGGGFGQVYRGMWRSSPVAVKVLLPVAQRDLNEESGFRSEVLMLASLRHPNVCLFMAACMAPPNRAIVTELVSRGSLWEALRRDALPCVASASYSRGACFRTPTGCWPWPAIMKVAEGMACGMHYLHRRDPAIIHRDLKSANLLLDDSFNVKICDFGLARLKSFTNTMTGKIGTVQWMAPEVIACSMYTETADVYSFGIVCWELLSRACPFEGLNDIQVGMAVLNDRRRPEIPEWCPRYFAALIENAWHQRASRRPSFGDILRHLRRNV